MPVRIPWDKYEVALLIQAYLRCTEGADFSGTAAELSDTLRKLASRRGIEIDETYRNVNGMKMQLGNVQWLFTGGEKGLSGTSALIHQMVDLYQNDRAEFQSVLKEAIRLTDQSRSVEDAFFAYAKGKTSLSPVLLSDYLKKASEYCHLRQPLLGMTDVQAVRNVQQEVVNGKFLRIRYGKNARQIRDITQLYYNFVKSYRPDKENEEAAPPAPSAQPEITAAIPQTQPELEVPVEPIRVQPEPKDAPASAPAQQEDLSLSGTGEAGPALLSPRSAYRTEQQDGILFADFSRDGDYQHTRPVFFIYRGVKHPATKWISLYVEVCRLLFADHHDRFMSVMNGDVPGYNTLAFADERHKDELRMARPFADGYYLEANIGAFSIMRCVRGLHRLFGLGDDLKIAYRRASDSIEAVPVRRPAVKTTAGFRRRLEIGFRAFLETEKHLAPGSVSHYCQSIEAVEQFMRERELPYTLDGVSAAKAQSIADALAARYDFTSWNDQQHCQYSAALAQYVQFLRQGGVMAAGDEQKQPEQDYVTIVEAVSAVLREASSPLTATEILSRIQERDLYHFNTDAPLAVVSSVIRKVCRGVLSSPHAQVDLFERRMDKAGKFRYSLLREDEAEEEQPISQQVRPADDRWLPILEESFPDGYILDDFLSQLQAGANWQERYGEACPAEGAEIDSAMKAVGAVRDGRVFAKSDEGHQLVASICAEIAGILSKYTNVYPSCVYDRYREQLAGVAIYTEQVMTQQLLAEAKGAFVFAYQVFTASGREVSAIQDCRTVLRDHGGAMHVRDVAAVLWFIPYDTVYHCLSVDDAALNIGNSTWMLAEHFPVTVRDAEKIGDMLDECFLTDSYVRAADLGTLLQKHLPSIAENLSGMAYMAVFHIVEYHLRDRFSFSKSIVSPKGAGIDFKNLYREFAADRETFTLTDLSAFADELKLPIYWESTFAGGAVRVSKTEFVNRSRISFDVDATDRALEDFCTGDFLPLNSVSPAMMMHLPPCGYMWNAYLLLSYVYGFSRKFRLLYNSIGMNGCYGAMVRRSCEEIGSYGALIERVLTDDDTWSTPADALSLLVAQGYQAVRRYQGIDAVAAKAKQNKLADGR